MATGIVLAAIAGAEERPARVAYRELRVLRDFYSPVWSPRGARLALQGKHGVYVYDATQPRSRPRIVAIGYWPRVAWSPDGEWLLIGAPAGPTSDSLRLEALSIRGRDRSIIYRGEDFWGPLWASDGFIYGWKRSTRPEWSRLRLEPPQGWRRRFERPSAPTIYFVGLSDDRGISRPRGFCDGAAAGEWTIVDWDSTGADNVEARDPGRGGTRFLVTLRGLSSRDHDQIFDSEGRVQARVGRFPTTEWISLSADGVWLAGHQEIDDPDRDNVVDGRLYVGDAKGTWSTRVYGTGPALSPRFAREGLYLCFEDPVKGGIHVGELKMHRP